MHFAIRYLTEYRYDEPVTDNLNALRVDAGDDAAPARRRLRRPRRPRDAAAPAPRLLRHDGDRVRHLQAARAAGDRRARARRDDRAAGRRPRPTGQPAEDAATPTQGGEYRLPFGDRARQRRCSTSWSALSRAADAGGDAAAPSRADPGPLRVPRRRHLRRLDGRGPARRPAPASARTSRTSRSCCCAATASPRATSPATCSRRRRTTSRADSAEVDTHAWVEALIPAPDGGEPVWVAADPTNRGLAGERHVKIGHGRHYSDVPPVKGVFRGGASGRARRVGADDPHRRRAARRAGGVATAGGSPGCSGAGNWGWSRR